MVGAEHPRLRPEISCSHPMTRSLVRLAARPHSVDKSELVARQEHLRVFLPRIKALDRCVPCRRCATELRQNELHTGRELLRLRRSGIDLAIKEVDTVSDFAAAKNRIAHRAARLF